MKFFKDEKNINNIITGSILIVIFFLLYNISFLYTAFIKLIKIFLPFILGLAIAFVLNVPLQKIEGMLFKNRKKYPDSKWAGKRRGWGLVITIFLVCIILGFVLNMIIPQLATTISQLVKQIPTGIQNLTRWADEKFQKYPMVMDVIQQFANDWQKILENAASVLKNSVNAIVEGGINAVSGFFVGVTNFIIGFIFALYVLIDKEKLGTQVKKVLYAFLPKQTTETILRLGDMSSKTFAGFVTGQCLEAVILGSMFFIPMTIIRIPYAILIGMLIMVTALIPIVGAFIGLIVGVILILLVDPVKAIIFIVLFFVLQQIEGNLIYPKVVGESVGLPGIWVLVSVTVGGNLFGVAGMLVFIPLISVLYVLFKDTVYKRLKEKKIKVE